MTKTKTSTARIELRTLAHALRVCTRNRPLRRGSTGRQRLNRLLMRLLSCSPPQAAQLVRRLESEGHLAW